MSVESGFGANKNKWPNIALFLILLASSCSGMVYAAFFVFSMLMSFPPGLFVALICTAFLLAWIQSFVLQINFTYNHAWYNRYWPNFLLIYLLTMPELIWWSSVVTRNMQY
jgi:hypothetical protein